MKNLDRREFLRRAAIGTAAAAWAAPVIQSVAATPAYAQSQGSPGNCFHSISPGKPNGCMETCTGIDPAGNAGSCNAVCGPACNLPNNACPPSYCSSGCWQIHPDDVNKTSGPKRRVFAC